MSRLTRIFPFAALLVVAACHDLFGPGDVASLSLGTNSVTPTVTTDANGYPVMRCDFTMHLAAHGKGSVTLGDATWRWYIGKGDRTVSDSSIMSADDMRNWLGTDTLEAGQTRDTPFWVSDGIPFTLEIEQRYTSSQGKSGSAKTSLVCGPSVPADAAPPTLTLNGVQPAGATVAPGENVTIGFTATSTVGLWETIAVVGSGGTTIGCDAQQVVPDNLAKQATLTATVHVPNDCPPGSPLSVGLVTFDAAGQKAQQLLSARFTIADTTPPTLSAVFQPSWQQQALPVPSGDFFVNDAIYTVATIHDNSKIAALLWRVLPDGQRDSMPIPVTTTDAQPHILMSVPAGWTAPTIQFELVARDASGNLSAPLVTPADSIRVRPTIAREIVQTSIPEQPAEIVPHPTRDLVYLLEPSSKRVAIHTASTLQLVGTIALPASPGGMDLTPGGDSLIVTLPASRAVAIIDLRASTPSPVVVPLTTLDSTKSQQPGLVRAMSNGKALIRFGGAYPGAYGITELDLATGAQRLRADAAVAGQALWMERSQDRSMLVLGGGYDGCLERYDAATDSFGSCQTAQLPYNVYRPTIDAHGDHFALNFTVLDGALQNRRVVQGRDFSTSAPTVLSPDGVYLYSPYLASGAAGGVVRTRLSDGRVQDRIGSFTAWTNEFWRISPDGTHLFMAGVNTLGMLDVSGV